jgi:hypothetical protein
LKTINGKPGITIELAKGMYEYKFTEGGWESVESLDKGLSAPNRKIVVESDTTVHVEIEQWASHFPKKEKVSTVSKNVHVVDACFTFCS